MLQLGDTHIFLLLSAISTCYLPMCIKLPLSCTVSLFMYFMSMRLNPSINTLHVFVYASSFQCQGWAHASFNKYFMHLKLIAHGIAVAYITSFNSICLQTCYNFYCSQCVYSVTSHDSVASLWDRLLGEAGC